MDRNQALNTAIARNHLTSDFRNAYPEFGPYMTETLWQQLEAYRAENPFPTWSDKHKIAQTLAVPNMLVDVSHVHIVLASPWPEYL